MSVVQLFRIHESYSANYLSITDAFEGDCGLSVAKGKFYSDSFDRLKRIFKYYLNFLNALKPSLFDFFLLFSDAPPIFLFLC